MVEFARDPDRSTVRVGAERAVPIALVHADPAAGVAGDASVREKIGRIGKNQIHILGWHGREYLQAVTLVDRDMVHWVRKSGYGQPWRFICPRNFTFSRCGLSENRIGKSLHPVCLCGQPSSKPRLDR
jgi:hypothetical protein